MRLPLQEKIRPNACGQRWLSGRRLQLLHETQFGVQLREPNQLEQAIGAPALS